MTREGESTALALSVRRATDVEVLHGILTECGVDMEMRLGLSHWVPAYPLRLFQQQAAKGKVYEVVTDDSEAIATFTLDREAPPYYGDIEWSPQGEPGVYVTRLAVRPANQGRGIGRWCMEWIESDVPPGGARSVRLDAYAPHTALLRFYRGLGYAERGTCEVRDSVLTCFEKVLAQPTQE